jgi:hypothetical protein
MRGHYAAFVYNTAMRPQMMPRVPMPKALPAEKLTTK